MEKVFDKLLRDYVNLDYSALVSVAQNALADIIPVCRQVDQQNNGALMVTAIIMSAISADGVLSEREQQFICDAAGLDEETLGKLVESYSKEEMELVDRFVDTLGDKVKASTLSLVIAIAACDETISHEETAFIEKLLK